MSWSLHSSVAQGEKDEEAGAQQFAAEEEEATPESDRLHPQNAAPKSHNYNIQFYHETNRKRPLSSWNVVLSWFYLNIHIACDINETDLSTFSERDTVQHLMSMKNYTDPESACGKLKTSKAKRCKKNIEYRPKLITQQGALGRFWKEEMRTNAHYSEISRRIQAVAKASQELYSGTMGEDHT